MELAPEWMTYKKDASSSQGSRVLGKERERGAPKYGKQKSFSYLSPAIQISYTLDQADRNNSTSAVPFACSISSPPAPPHTPASILGDPNPRVLNRSKSSPGFGSPKSKQKKSPDRAFSSFKPLKPKPQKPPLSPSSYSKSQSQPNLFNNEKAANWHQQKLLHQLSNLSSAPSAPSPLAISSSVAVPPPPPAIPTTPPSTSPPLPIPPSPSPPPAIVPEIDKLKNLIPTTGMPPKSVRPRVMVGPPLPLAKKAPTMQPPGSPSTVSGAAAAAAAVAPNALSSYFRKATSEPSLMHHKVNGTQTAQDAMVAARRAEAAAKKARALETEKAQIQLLKEAVASKQPKRSNFFHNVIKQEEQGVPLEDDSPIGIDQMASPTAEAQNIPFSPPISPPPLSPPPPAGIRSPLPEDMEDEERFLRTLGWVPDEEDPVPVLDEEEIREVKVKICLSKANKQEANGGSGGMQNVGIDVK